MGKKTRKRKGSRERRNANEGKKWKQEWKGNEQRRIRIKRNKWSKKE